MLHVPPESNEFEDEIIPFFNKWYQSLVKSFDLQKNKISSTAEEENDEEKLKPSPTIESTSAEGQNKQSTTAENRESTDSILSKPAVKFVKADFDDSSVYSISEGEGDVHQNISIMVQDTPIEEAAFMAIEERSWKPDKELPTQSKRCEHDWKENVVTNYTICYYCRILTIDISRLNCPKCQLTSCALCVKNYLGKTVNVKRKQQHKPEEEKDFSSNEVRLLKEPLKEKTEQVQQMIRDQAKEYYESKIAIKEKEELWQTERS
nr:hypothetical protein [Tanacetum cinerariifolium]